MFDFNPQFLVRLHPQRNTYYISQNRTILEVNADGIVPPNSRFGLYASKTRLLSLYRYLINGVEPESNVVGNVRQHSWLGYFISSPPELRARDKHTAELSEHTIELRVARYVGDGVHEDLDFTNFTTEATAFRFEIELDADFADRQEVESGQREQFGRISQSWRQNSEGKGELHFNYFAEHCYEHQGNEGTASLRRGVIIRITASDSPAVFDNGRIGFDVELAARGSWHACIEMLPVMEDRELKAGNSCRSFFTAASEYGHLRDRFLQKATKFQSVNSSLTPLVCALLERCKEDLIGLRLYDFDQREDAWVMSAGLPMYVALFGRDTLTAAWEAALLGPEMMRGTLAELAKWQGQERNDWRDEQPGRMIHEAHDSPLALLQFRPHARYYGSITTSAFYPVVVSELWHWTGDKNMIRPLLDPALGAIRWLDHYTNLRGDGFHYYKTRSSQGLKNQAWKDSGEAIVREDGSQVEPPIATCEEQGFVYASKFHFAEVLWWLDRKDEAKRLYRDAEELKKRFNDAFWMEDQGTFALGLDSHGKQIRSITSNPGHCIATGIVDNSRVGQTAARLLTRDMFSGWGVRTLSCNHPAFNPYSYHRGSVWPAEHGAFAIGFFRYGLWAHLHTMARALFEAAAIFDFYRLPEVFSGHARDDDHPFPALYPRTNWPQAWSAAAMFTIMQAILGIYPYAPLNLLLVDPHLPEWLPEITVKDLRVGEANVTIRFFREENGTSDYRVEAQEGSLHVLRQPSPWSLVAGFGERTMDALTSLLPGHRG